MKKKTAALVAIIIIAIIVVGTYGVHIFSANSAAGSQKGTVSFMDSTGLNVEISTPVNRIVSLSNGLTEIICALGCTDKIVGRDETSTFPPAVADALVVGESSYNPSLEQLLGLKPDLVLSDGMMSNDLRGKIEAAGVPVFIEDPNDPQRIKNFTQNMGILLDKQSKANEMVTFVEQYENIVHDRVADLSISEKPTVYFEWGDSWSAAAGTVFDSQITESGGVNIAGTQSALYPTLSAEFVIEANPDVILKSVSQSDTVEQLQATRTDVINRAGYSELTAVKNDKVFIYDSQVGLGIRRVIGLLYWAKWFHPDLFGDIDPTAINAQMVHNFYGVEPQGVYTYP